MNRCRYRDDLLTCTVLLPGSETFDVECGVRTGAWSLTKRSPSLTGFCPFLLIAEKADVTLTLSDTDLVDLMLGKLDSQKAFFQGKLKIKGNMGLAMRLKAFQSEMDKYKAKL